MKSLSFILAFFTLAVTTVSAQGVTSAISPQAGFPAGCSGSYSGKFEITVAKVEGAAKRSVNTIAKRGDCSTNGILVAQLQDGILKDAQARTGYVAANYQFQFDGPPQTGAIYTAGFSACSNGSLALGGSAVFYQCASGDFYNLYDRSWAPQCSPVEIIIMPCGEGTASQAGDGQVVGTQIVTTTVVSALSDGQPQVRTTTTGIPVCQVSQIADGQVQVGTTPCASITTTPVAISNPAPVSQQTDGQINVTPPASVPTVTNPAPAPPAVSPSAPPAASAPGAPAPSASSVVLPSETQPASSGTTLATTATSVGSSGTTPSTTAATSAPATGGATVQAASMAALFIGVIGAVAFI
ncbi:covalently-linked cell wall protein [Diaporthe amygdali]|uniref:covalently-linked cell wall protein n=1 Tax=Phomopsis amygdali TaxID=1214568 RepID=UPI0022FE1379|nr:covalently-linked cell wall protein [Diaporthe amygdali]KAJ0119824.1 covalently-linked cell wall protein [Diaporthe amygdali]